MHRVLVVYDVPLWAEHRHAVGLQKYAPPEFEVDIASHGEWGRMSPRQRRSYDTIHHLWLPSARRGIGVRRLTTMLASPSWMYHKLLDHHWQTRGTGPCRNAKIAGDVLPGVDAVVARNSRLAEFGKSFNPNTRFIPVGVDTEIFNPAGRQYHLDEPRLGWCGNPAGISSYKGYEEVLLPLKDRMPEQQWAINTTCAAEKIKTAERMANWYRGIDVFLCTAVAEGTPNPVYEAMACGCLVLSTPVGGVVDIGGMTREELLSPAYHNELSAKAVVDWFVDRINCVRRDPSEFEHVARAMSQHLVVNYSYHVMSPTTLKFVAGV